jgi:hypothetical protein
MTNPYIPLEVALRAVRSGWTPLASYYPAPITVNSPFPAKGSYVLADIQDSDSENLSLRGETGSGHFKICGYVLFRIFTEGGTALKAEREMASLIKTLMDGHREYSSTDRWALYFEPSRMTRSAKLTSKLDTNVRTIMCPFIYTGSY